MGFLIIKLRWHAQGKPQGAGRAYLSPAGATELRTPITFQHNRNEPTMVGHEGVIKIERLRQRPTRFESARPTAGLFGNTNGRPAIGYR